MVGVEHLPRMLRVEALLRALAPRHGEQPVEVRADHLRLAGLVAHALEARELALGLLANRVRHLGLGDALAVVLGRGAVVLAELLADRVHLAAQDVVALLLLCAALHVLANAAAHLQLGEALALQTQRELEALDDVHRLEQLDLLDEADVGCVGGRVGERAGLGDRAHEVVHPLVGLAQVEDLLDDGAVLTLQLGGLDPRRALVGPFVDLDAQPAVGAGVGCARDPAVQSGQGDRAAAARQPHRPGHLGDGADGGVLAVAYRDEEDPLGLADLDGQRDRHVGEDDAVLERDQQQI